MNVKLSLSKNQLEAIHMLVKDGRKRNTPFNVPDSLLDDLMDKLQERLRNKIKKLTTDRKKLKLTLTSVEAKAFYCWYQNIQTDMEPNYQYEVIVCDQVYREIDKICA